MLGGRSLAATDFIATWRQWRSFLREQVLVRLAGIDALITPATVKYQALPLEVVDRSIDTYNGYNSQYLRNTFIGSVLNWCGISLPCGLTDQGLPIGLMIYGKPFQEAVILRLAYAYEQATTWHRSHPDLSWVA